MWERLGLEVAEGDVGDVVGGLVAGVGETRAESTGDLERMRRRVRETRE